jgi:hypothetical protein
MIKNLEFHRIRSKMLKESLLYNKLKQESKKINLIWLSGLFNMLVEYEMIIKVSFSSS